MEDLVHKEAKISDKQKDLYIATLAHDLKNPISAQIVVLEQFYKGKFGGITTLQKEILSDTIKSSKFMLEMLSSLLCIYKFDNGIVKLNKTPVNLDSLINTCLKDITPLSEEHSILIEYINTASDNILYCDESYIRRLISNMLNNLVLYSYKHTKSFVILEEDLINKKIRFKSTGYPISEDLKQHIFEKYRTGGNKKSGTGLGLYFCKKAAEAHGGIIELNAINSDIEFIVSLPKQQNGENSIKFV